MTCQTLSVKKVKFYCSVYFDSDQITGFTMYKIIFVHFIYVYFLIHLLNIKPKLNLTFKYYLLHTVLDLTGASLNHLLICKFWNICHMEILGP